MTYHRQLTALSVLLAAVALVTLFAAGANADPLPGQVPKFKQAPMIATPIQLPNAGLIVSGHDELSTAWLSTPVPPQPGVDPEYRGVSMADDFADNFDSPVVHVTWWGSYLNNFINPLQPVRKFLIAFEEDIPAGQPDSTGTVLPYSRPGNVLSTQIVDLAAVLAPGSGTYTEQLIPGGLLVKDVYKYNAELFLDKQFPQVRDEIYWLKIVALIDAPQTGTQDTQWGWRNRDYTISNPLASPNVLPGEVNQQPAIDPLYPAEVWHFQDNAVESLVTITIDDPTMPNMPTVVQVNPLPVNYLDDLDGPGPDPGFHGGIGQFSKDLAFELYTIPEPATCMLMLIGLAGTVGRRFGGKS